MGDLHSPSGLRESIYGEKIIKPSELFATMKRRISALYPCNPCKVIALQEDEISDRRTFNVVVLQFSKTISYICKY